jgi:hypothetical protein
VKNPKSHKKSKTHYRQVRKRSDLEFTFLTKQFEKNYKRATKLKYCKENESKSQSKTKQWQTLSHQKALAKMTLKNNC